uniref:Uncharacterized protein n=1 Tax=Burkholderia cenocepacia TaxID=95486 RepID=A0A071M546_9BURK
MLESRQQAFSVLPHTGNGALAETLFAHGSREHGHMQRPFAAQIARIVTAVHGGLLDWSTERIYRPDFVIPRIVRLL